jgi:predicted N-acetyltransferase YhbS
VAPQELFAAYVADRRSRALPSFDSEQMPHLVCHTPTNRNENGIVSFAVLDPKRAERQIYEKIQFFEKLGLGIEWKVYEFDQPADLVSRLEANGFAPGETEALLSLSLSEESTMALEMDLDTRIRLVETESELAPLISVQAAVWQRDFSSLHATLLDAMRTAPDTYTCFCAYGNGLPVGAGYVQFPRGSPFPQFYGGAVLPQWRGKGIYRALVSAGVNAARERMYDFVLAESTHAGYPMMQKIGFQMVCHTRTMFKKPPLTFESSVSI